MIDRSLDGKHKQLICVLGFASALLPICFIILLGWSVVWLTLDTAEHWWDDTERIIAVEIGIYKEKCVPDIMNNLDENIKEAKEFCEKYGHLWETHEIKQRFLLRWLENKYEIKRGKE